MPQIQRVASTTPVIRAAIAQSRGHPRPTYGEATKTVGKWRKQGGADRRYRTARPHRLFGKGTDQKRAAACAAPAASPLTI